MTLPSTRTSALVRGAAPQRGDAADARDGTALARTVVAGGHNKILDRTLEANVGRVDLALAAERVERVDDALHAGPVEHGDRARLLVGEARLG